MRPLPFTLLVALSCSSSSVAAEEPEAEEPNAEEPFAEAPDTDRPSRVRLVLPACTLSSVDVGAYAAIVRVELAGDGRLTDVCWPHEPCEGPNAAFNVRLEYLRCDSDVSAAVLSIQHLGTGRVEAHTIRFDDVEIEARPRNLALAAVELFRRVHVELSQTAPSAAEPEEPPPPILPEPTPAATPGPLPGPARLRVDLMWTLRLTPDLDAGLAGPAVSAALRVAELPIRLRARVALVFGNASDAIGEIDVRALSGALSIEALARNGLLELGLGPYLEVGWLHGQAAGGAPGITARSGNDVVAAAGLALSLSVRLVGPVRALAALAVGHSIKAATFGSDGGAQGGIGGPLLDLSLGAALEF